jgi:hypothetical protein
MVVTAASCGLRFGELAALQRRHVNPLQREIVVEQAMSQVPGRGAVVKTPKKSSMERFRSMMWRAGDKHSDAKATAGEKLVADCLVYPPPDRWADLTQAHNGVLDVVAAECHRLAEAKAEVEGKE